MNAPTNASNKLKGTAILKIPFGKTSRFQRTVHIMQNPINHDIKVVCNILYFFERIKIAMANVTVLGAIKLVAKILLLNGFFHPILQFAKLYH
jgi:hypothetical protein